ncbi:hypothetical protein [Actinomadura sp. J1-007]|uniref:hypothetical protein n=1 Tax=Actinomadura sp. J1-007 TaxID=2661913 RepID=UPI0028161472|nr:hypothetical protein [Actinomadura sp. J1-007]
MDARAIGEARVGDAGADRPLDDVLGELVGVHLREALGDAVERGAAIVLVRHGQAVPRSVDNDVVKGR